jgi:Fe-S oxidoreductase
MKVGELKLFPKIREMASSDRSGREGVLSSGAACRMQIRQGTDVEAIHPILLIADLVKEWSANDKR